MYDFYTDLYIYVHTQTCLLQSTSAKKILTLRMIINKYKNNKSWWECKDNTCTLCRRMWAGSDTV